MSFQKIPRQSCDAALAPVSFILSISGRSHYYLGLLRVCAQQNSILVVDPVGMHQPFSRERRCLLIGLSPFIVIGKFKEIANMGMKLDGRVFAYHV